MVILYSVLEFETGCECGGERETETERDFIDNQEGTEEARGEEERVLGERETDFSRFFFLQERLLRTQYEITNKVKRLAPPPRLAQIRPRGASF